MTRLTLVTLAIAIILAGAVVLPMPVPFGAIMMLGGLTILISQSPFVARNVQAVRRQHLSVDHVIRRVEARLPERLRNVIRRTDP